MDTPARKPTTQPVVSEGTVKTLIDPHADRLLRGEVELMEKLAIQRSLATICGGVVSIGVRTQIEVITVTISRGDDSTEEFELDYKN